MQVAVSSSTTVTVSVERTLADIAVGDSISASGETDGTVVTAETIQIGPGGMPGAGSMPGAGGSMPPGNPATTRADWTIMQLVRRLAAKPFVVMPLVAVLGLGAWWGLRSDDGADSSTADAADQVVEATTGPMAVTVSAEGTVAAAETDDLSFTSAGTVTAVNCRPATRSRPVRSWPPSTPQSWRPPWPTRRPTWPTPKQRCPTTRTRRPGRTDRRRPEPPHVHEQDRPPLRSSSPVPSWWHRSTAPWRPSTSRSARGSHRAVRRQRPHRVGHGTVSRRGDR